MREGVEFERQGRRWKRGERRVREEVSVIAILHTKFHERQTAYKEPTNIHIQYCNRGTFYIRTANN